MTVSASIDTKGWRRPFFLRGSGTFANIVSKWQEEVLVMLHLKSVVIFRVKYSKSRVKSHATFAFLKILTPVKNTTPKTYN